MQTIDKKKYFAKNKFSLLHNVAYRVVYIHRKQPTNREKKMKTLVLKIMEDGELKMTHMTLDKGWSRKRVEELAIKIYGSDIKKMYWV